MFHIITTSRTTRALHRFQSLAERLASILTRCGVFACRAALVAFLGVLLAICAAPELFLTGGAE